ncbi:LOW QUALITY PROTEIN: phenazine biosynthesis-like domain-containing protein [Macrochelys suwanniensis]
MKISVFTVDAFTCQSFCGNLIAVCLLEDELHEDSHQKIAVEMNLSETHPTDDFTKSSCFGLRWFMPSNGPLCGHAPLASAALFHIKKYNNFIYLTMPVNYLHNPQILFLLLQLLTFDHELNVTKCCNGLSLENRNTPPNFLTLSREARQAEDNIILDLALYLDTIIFINFCSPGSREMKISLRNYGRIDVGGQIVIVLIANLTF